MGLIAEWRASRERRHRAERYLDAVLTPAEAADLAWLSGVAGDAARARREMDFLRRAVALIVAERDALNDQTAADVAHALTARAHDGVSASASDTTAWSGRFREYSAAMAVRGNTEPPATRLARVLMESLGRSTPSANDVERAAQLVQSARNTANEALRKVFGVASLPDDIRPSALRS